MRAYQGMRNKSAAELQKSPLYSSVLHNDTARPRAIRPVGNMRTLLQFQQQYGNRYLRRAVELSRRKEGVSVSELTYVGKVSNLVQTQKRSGAIWHQKQVYVDPNKWLSISKAKIVGRTFVINGKTTAPAGSIVEVYRTLTKATVGCSNNLINLLKGTLPFAYGFVFPMGAPQRYWTVIEAPNMTTFPPGKGHAIIVIAYKPDRRSRKNYVYAWQCAKLR